MPGAVVLPIAFGETYKTNRLSTLVPCSCFLSWNILSRVCVVHACLSVWWVRAELKETVTMVWRRSLVLNPAAHRKQWELGWAPCWGGWAWELAFTQAAHVILTHSRVKNADAAPLKDSVDLTDFLVNIYREERVSLSSCPRQWDISATIKKSCSQDADLKARIFFPHRTSMLRDGQLSYIPKQMT